VFRIRATPPSKSDLARYGELHGAAHRGDVSAIERLAKTNLAARWYTPAPTCTSSRTTATIA
jgi:hypothetical protein